jgi:hypothetical protein
MGLVLKVSLLATIIAVVTDTVGDGVALGGRSELTRESRDEVGRDELCQAHVHAPRTYSASYFTNLIRTFIISSCCREYNEVMLSFNSKVSC